MKDLVLWVSRHRLDPEAIKALGDPEIIMTDILFSNDGEEALKQLLDASEGYDLVGGVFPAQLWVALLRHPEVVKKMNMFVVVAVPATAADGQTRTFKFDHIEKIR